MKSPVTEPQETRPVKETAVNETEAEICFICASSIVHQSVAPCNHRTCHICSLRMRVLYKTKACAHCRTDSEFVVFTDEPEKRYDDFTSDDFPQPEQTDNKLGIKYEKGEILEDTVLLLRYNCPDSSCDVACFSWPDLHRHVRTQHNKIMCDLCIRNKKVFAHEHELFTPASLRKHERHGDDNPGAIDQSGFKGHPECGFCRQRFYGDDELYHHCRDRHERCHICDRTSQPGNRQQQYYLDYNSLEIHFSKDHFLCPDKECLDKKFVVFGSEIDLKAHQLEAHPNGLTKDARRDARHVDMRSFNYRNSHEQDQRGNRREGRGRGRGRDPNANVDIPLPASSAQPMRRDELAYQRRNAYENQMAVHSAQSVSTRSFGGQLTRNEALAARPDPNISAPATVMAPREGGHTTPLPTHAEPSTTPASSLPNISSLDLSAGTPAIHAPTGNLTPSERARFLRHASLTERASNLLGRSEPKINTFRSQISAYKNSTLTAQQLIDSFFALFECSSSDLGTLIKELADAFEVPGKADDLRKAWNDWRAINEDYPGLPGNIANASSSTMSSAGGKRILKLKNSTAQSRSVASTTGSWGTAGSAARPSGRNDLFPALPSGTSTTRSKPAWLPTSNAHTTDSRVSTQSVQPTAGRSAGNTGPAPRPDAFPALPAAQKMGMSALRPGQKTPVRRDGAHSPAPVNAWAGGALAGPPPVVDSDDAGGKKGKGKKKQTLIHWG